MNWSDERFVRLFTRDTVAWVSLPWESRCVLPLVLRKLDRSGVLELGDLGLEGLAGLIQMPADIVERGMAKLIARGTFVLDSHGWLLMPNFIEAQEATVSDRQRQAESRARRAELACSVTKRDMASRSVTERHELSRGVTSGHSVPSVPSVPSEPDLSASGMRDGAQATLIPVDSQPDQRERWALEVYAAFPRKVGKSAGIKAIKTQLRTLADAEAAKQAARNYAAHVADLIERRDLHLVKQFDTWAKTHWRDWVNPEEKPPTRASARPANPNGIDVSRYPTFSE